MNQFKAIFLGGGPADGLLLSKARDHTLPIVLSYGMTETAGMVCAQSQEAFLSEFFFGETFAWSGIKLSEKDGFKILEVYSKSLFYGYWGGQAFEKAEAFAQMTTEVLKDGEVVIEGEWIIGLLVVEKKLILKKLKTTFWPQATWNRSLFWVKIQKSGDKHWSQLLFLRGLNQQELIANMNQYLKQTLANHKLPKAYLLVEELPILENGNGIIIVSGNCSIQLMCDSIMWVKKYFKFTANH